MASETEPNSTSTAEKSVAASPLIVRLQGRCSLSWDLGAPSIAVKNVVSCEAPPSIHPRHAQRRALKARSTSAQSLHSALAADRWPFTKAHPGATALVAVLPRAPVAVVPA